MQISDNLQQIANAVEASEQLKHCWYCGLLSIEVYTQLLRCATAAINEAITGIMEQTP